MDQSDEMLEMAAAVFLFLVGIALCFYLWGQYSSMHRMTEQIVFEKSDFYEADLNERGETENIWIPWEEPC